MLRIFKKDNPNIDTFTTEDVKREIAERAQIRFKAKEVPVEALGSGAPKKASPKVNDHPHAATLKKLAKILDKVEDVDNQKVDTLRLLYLHLADNGEDGSKEKDFIKFLKTAPTPKQKVQKVIKVTVTKD
jgi:hypothetical protein